MAGILQPMALASSVAALGVPSAVAYFIGRGYNEKHVLKSAFKVSALITAVAAIILLYYSQRISHQTGIHRGIVILLWCTFLPSAFVAIRRGQLQGRRTYGGIDRERMLQSVLRIIFIPAIFWAGITSAVMYTTVHMAAVLLASLGLYFTRSTQASIPGDPERGLERWELPRYALLLSLGAIASTMNARFDQAVMPAVVSPIELGYYAVAVTVAEVPLIINAVTARNILAETSARMSRRHILGSFLLGGVAQLVLTMSLFVITPYVLPFVFSHGFAPAVALVKILLLSTLISYAADCTSAYLAGRGNAGYASLCTSVGAATTVALFVFFWHSMSAVAASWISVATQASTLATGLVILSILARRSRRREASNAPAGAQ
jgi:O-antigen/teichoic acid export membrane protein